MKSFLSNRIFGKVGMNKLLTFLYILLINIPVFIIVIRVNFKSNANWEHYKNTILPDAISNTILLVLFTLLLSGMIGVLSATIIALFDFPGKHFLELALYIPMTIPPYIAAYVYAGMFSYTGIIQRLFRDWGITLPYQWFDIMNIRGAVVIYSLTLYPYIYGAVKTFLEHHSGNLIDTARILGYTPFKLFLKVILPLIRIPLIGGLMLVMMEVISDYGVIRYFNIHTVSSILFSSWFGMGETGVAIRLSFYLLISIIALQFFEEMIRGRKKYNLSSKNHSITVIKLKGITKYLAIFFILLILTSSFVIPVGQMMVWAYFALPKVSLPGLGKILYNTLFNSLLAATIIIILNIQIAHNRRWFGKKLGLIISKLTQLGYSIPGAIIAIGTISLFVAMDNFLFPIYQYFNSNSKKLLLSTSIIMLVFAFVVRYMAIGFNNVNSAFAKVGTKYNDAARTLGIGKSKAMLTVELPLLKNSLITGFLLTFIDIIKELPLTLLLRPFNYNTLASRVYEYANDERIQEASVPALLIIVLSILAIIIFIKMNTRKGGIKRNEIRN